MKCATLEEIQKGGMSGYYNDHGRGICPVDASGVPFTVAGFKSKGNPIVDLIENLVAEQKARATYEYLINMADYPDVIEPLKFLREREVVHSQRFGSALRIVQDYLQEPHLFLMHKPV